MATSSILGGTPAPEEISGKDVRSLGPSDISDSGSDTVGAYDSEALASDTDAVGTGENASIGPGSAHPDADILPDQVEQAPGPQADAGMDIERDLAGALPGESGDVSAISDVEQLAGDTEGADEDAGYDDRPDQA